MRSTIIFFSHTWAIAVVVFDTLQRKVIATIPDVSHVHGVLYVPQLNRVYASATGTSEVVAIDALTFKAIARVPGGDYPDGMAYAPDVHKLYVSDEHGGTDTVIDTTSNRRIATIPLGGEVGNTQYDPVSRRIFANVQTRDELAEIDPATDKVVARINLPGAKGNHGLYVDAPARIAFIACEGNDGLLVLDLTSVKCSRHSMLPRIRTYWPSMRSSAGSMSPASPVRYRCSRRTGKRSARSPLHGWGRMPTLLRWSRPRTRLSFRSSLRTGRRCCGSRSPSQKDDVRMTAFNI